MPVGNFPQSKRKVHSKLFLCKKNFNKYKINLLEFLLFSDGKYCDILGSRTGPLTCSHTSVFTCVRHDSDQERIIGLTGTKKCVFTGSI